MAALLEDFYACYGIISTENRDTLWLIQGKVKIKINFYKTIIFKFASMRLLTSDVIIKYSLL